MAISFSSLNMNWHKPKLGWLIHQFHQWEMGRKFCLTGNVCVTVPRIFEGSWEEKKILYPIDNVIWLNYNRIQKYCLSTFYSCRLGLGFFPLSFCSQIKIFVCLFYIFVFFCFICSFNIYFFVKDVQSLINLFLAKPQLWRNSDLSFWSLEDETCQISYHPCAHITLATFLNVLVCLSWYCGLSPVLLFKFSSKFA